jgi:hypothetical protein
MKHAVCAKAKRDRGLRSASRLSSGQTTKGFTLFSVISLTFMQTKIQKKKPTGPVIIHFILNFLNLRTQIERRRLAGKQNFTLTNPVVWQKSPMSGQKNRVTYVKLGVAITQSIQRLENGRENRGTGLRFRWKHQFSLFHGVKTCSWYHSEAMKVQIIWAKC